MDKLLESDKSKSEFVQQQHAHNDYQIRYVVQGKVLKSISKDRHDWIKSYKSLRTLGLQNNLVKYGISIPYSCPDLNYVARYINHIAGISWVRIRSSLITQQCLIKFNLHIEMDLNGINTCNKESKFDHLQINFASISWTCLKFWSKEVEFYISRTNSHLTLIDLGEDWLIILRSHLTRLKILDLRMIVEGIRKRL